MPDTYRYKFVEPAKPVEYEQQYAAGSYGEILWLIERQQLLEVIGQFRRDHSTIDYLDFAAGTGRIISFVEDHVDSAVGVDISQAMAAIAQKRLKRGKMICADITMPDAPVEGRYDLITAFRFFLNADPEMRVSALRALALRLKDESSRIIFNNHGNFWSHKLGMWPYHALRRAGRGFISEGNYMTLHDAKRLAREAGLVIDSVMGCGVLGPKAQWLIPFDPLSRLESSVSRTALARYCGVNQMYIARIRRSGPT